MFFVILPETFTILLSMRNFNEWYSGNGKDFKTLWPVFKNGAQLPQG